MKKLIISTAAIIMAFSFSAIAGTPETKEGVKTETVTTSTTLYHWFDPITGQSLEEHMSLEDKQANCGQPGQVVCALGYEDLDPQGNPQGTPIETKRN